MVFVWPSGTHRQALRVLHSQWPGPKAGLILTQAWRKQKPGLTMSALAAMSLGFCISRAPLPGRRKWFCIPRPVMDSAIASLVNCGWTLNPESFTGTFPIWVGRKPHGPVFLAPGIGVLAF